ncbi:NAD(P)-dependent oxidoreductase [Pectobacterium cacticida]|uniref:NAD(P)-dependent oxidoreductase n=1 Tax=Pectobacterium cacticida TaxID=69221 RepID=A0ABZ2GBE1_9GAMM|nr:NAD(P)-dependent oxidoreductase [Pectobacterium cacticida]UYX06477.1 NAD(P)-dependent oxidoreductase [Pectobacterium cacticida]
MAHIALIGASGRVGSRIVKELSDRGHTVTAIARHPEKILALAGVTAKAGDVNDRDTLVKLLAGHDAVVSAVNFRNADPHSLIETVRASGVKRYLVVGGAGGLKVASGERLFDQPDFPDAYRPEASKGIEFYAALREEKELDWVFLSPSAEFVPGERTGKFRVGSDQLLTNEQGSRISFEDYAVAMVDEIEKPAHSRQRFTVGY